MCGSGGCAAGGDGSAGSRATLAAWLLDLPLLCLPAWVWLGPARLGVVGACALQPSSSSSSFPPPAAAFHFLVFVVDVVAAAADLTPARCSSPRLGAAAAAKP